MKWKKRRLNQGKDLVEITLTPDGKKVISFNLHEGQTQAYQSEKRFVLILSGTQGGKTSIGPLLLYKAMQEYGPGDYLAVAPTYKLMDKKMLPEFRRFFEYQLALGKYVSAPKQEFQFSEEGSMRLFGEYDPASPTRVIFGHAQDPEGLESMTCLAAWLDEAGQDKFREGSWDSILRRLSLSQGPVYITTTPYNFGWLKERLYDPWERYNEEGLSHPEIDVIRFESRMNPRFPMAEWERAQRDLPPWKFDMMYRAIFTRPAGLIYDNFETEQVIPRFPIPAEWPRYLGLDFGGTNTAAIFVAEDPETKNLYYYRTYRAGGRTAREHVEALRIGEEGRLIAYGGAPSEDQWRDEFAAAGLYVGKPYFQGVDSVEVGINRVYGAHARKRIFVFDDLKDYLKEKQKYSREIDDDGQVTPEIADKHKFHLMDAERYIVGGYLERPVFADPLPPIQFQYGGHQPKADYSLPSPFSG